MDLGPFRNCHPVPPCNGENDSPGELDGILAKPLQFRLLQAITNRLVPAGRTDRARQLPHDRIGVFPGQEEHVDGETEALVLRHSRWLVQQCRHVQKREIARRTERCRIQVVLRRDPALVQAGLEVGRCVERGLLRRVEATVRVAGRRTVVLLVM